MPPNLSVLAEEVQAAFFIYGLLPDRIDSMGGTYQGKDLSALGTLYDIYEIEEKQLVTTFLMRIQQINVEQINADLSRRRKAERAKHGGKE